MDSWPVSQERVHSIYTRSKEDIFRVSMTDDTVQAQQPCTFAKKKGHPKYFKANFFIPHLTSLGLCMCEAFNGLIMLARRPKIPI